MPEEAKELSIVSDALPLEGCSSSVIEAEFVQGWDGCVGMPSESRPSGSSKRAVASRRCRPFLKHRARLSAVKARSSSPPALSLVARVTLLSTHWQSMKRSVASMIASTSLDGTPTNSPERSECTSELAARRTRLWQGADTAEAPWRGRGTALEDPVRPGASDQEGNTDVIRWQRTLQRPYDATAPLRRAIFAACTRQRGQAACGLLRQRKGHHGSHAPVT